MLTYCLLSKEDKKELCNWKYEGRYEVYNLPSYFILKLFRSFFFDPYSEKDYLGFYDQGKLIGFTQLVILNEEAILGIGVHPDYLDQGYGTEMLKIMDQKAIERFPALPYCLLVRVWNDRAIHTYEKNGFEIISKPFEHQGAMFYKMQRKSLGLYLPSLSELHYRRKLCEDPSTMSFNHQIVPFPMEKWEGWYQKWNDEDHFYRYIYDFDTYQFVGEVAYRNENNETIISIIIEAGKRNQGYGTKALHLLLEAARHNGIQEVVDNLAKDNESISLFLKQGFSIVEENDTIIKVKKQLD